jgi:hypothetical protein
LGTAIADHPAKETSYDRCDQGEKYDGNGQSLSPSSC